MGSCVAFNCTNRCSKKIPGLTFHSFPKDETRRKLWMKAVRRKNWKPTKFSKLCSKHFPEEMIDRTSLSCVRLRENAVPSIFDFSSHLPKSSGTASREEEKKDHIPLEPTVEIKEEPVDYQPTPSTSTDTANEEFILPHEENTWTPSVHAPPDPVVEPQLTLSVASLASPNNLETSDELITKKRKIKTSTFVPSTNGPEVTPQSPLYNFGDSSNPGSSKESRKDQFDIFGEYIAAKLRSLDLRSRAYAQKAIGDIIFEAEMGKFLNEDSDCKDLKNCAS